MIEVEPPGRALERRVLVGGRRQIAVTAQRAPQAVHHLAKPRTNRVGDRATIVAVKHERFANAPSDGAKGLLRREPQIDIGHLDAAGGIVTEQDAVVVSQLEHVKRENPRRRGELGHGGRVHDDEIVLGARGRHRESPQRVRVVGREHRQHVDVRFPGLVPAAHCAAIEQHRRQHVAASLAQRGRDGGQQRLERRRRHARQHTAGRRVLSTRTMSDGRRSRLAPRRRSTRDAR